MSDGYVLAGYGITVGALGLYALRVVSRGRALSRSLRETHSHPERRARSERPEAP